MSTYKSAEKTELMEKHSPVDWEFELSVGKGWQGIVDRLTKQIAEVDSTFEIRQIKEKFGGLRYYAHFANCDDADMEVVGALIGKAEFEASCTCECCGTQIDVERKSLERGWVITACGKCRDALEKEG